MDIIFILDESESMKHHAACYIQGINNILFSQKQQLKFTNSSVSIIKFNDHVHPLFFNKNIDDVTPLLNHHYSPDHGTALYSAITTTITHYRTVRRNNKALYVIITDGDDNTVLFERRALIQKAKTMIEDEMKSNSEFIFISPLENFKDVATRIGVVNCCRFSETKKSINMIMLMINSAISKLHNDEQIDIPENLTDSALEKMFQNMSI